MHDGGAGLDLGGGDEKELVARLAVMYLVPACVGLIVRLERDRRQAAMTRERRMNQERIDLSQAIHDTTAQTAYMIDLGIDRARELARDSNQELVAALDGISALSRTAIWEMRGPIDAGRIFQGRELGRVLWSHCATFERITSVASEMRSWSRARYRRGGPSGRRLCSNRDSLDRDNQIEIAAEERPKRVVE